MLITWRMSRYNFSDTLKRLNSSFMCIADIPCVVESHGRQLRSSLILIILQLRLYISIYRVFKLAMQI